MNQEIEIQVGITDPQKAEQAILNFGKQVSEKKQTDKYYVLKDRDFFKKDPPEEYLRIRFQDGKSHLNYSFLKFKEDGWLDYTNEYETIVEDPKTVEEIFEKIGLIHAVNVIKNRKIFMCGDFEVTLDKIEGLGDFMEIEAKKDLGGSQKTREACYDLIKKFGIEYIDKKEGGYPRMLYNKLKDVE